ncbi:MAG: hypothetical protein LBQ56_06585, partial [Synergistaceae bacterium]|nr:hypothetical protein [Synergistaceae bacterium]
FSGLDFGDGRPKAVFVRTRVDQGLSSAGVLEDSVRPMSDDEMEHALSLLERQSGSGRVFEDGA